MERAIEAYLHGGVAIWAFHRRFMDAWVDNPLPEEEAKRWFEIYELVYMAEPDSGDPPSGYNSVRDEADLKAQLREFREQGHGKTV